LLVLLLAFDIVPPPIAAAIEAASTELWADPARHKYWRHRTGAARRRIVANAFAGLPSAGFLAIAQFPWYQVELPGPAAHNGGA
jgi:hypothetical protein